METGHSQDIACTQLSRKLSIPITTVRRIKCLRFHRGIPMSWGRYEVGTPWGVISLSVEDLLSQTRFACKMFKGTNRLPRHFLPRQWRDIVGLVAEAAEKQRNGGGAGECAGAGAADDAKARDESGVPS